MNEVSKIQPSAAPLSVDPFVIPAEVRDETRQGGFNILELWASIYRSRLYIAGIFALCMTIALGHILLATRYYQSTVSVEVRQEAEKVLGTEADREGAASKMDSDRFLQTQLDIIRSRSVANAVAEALGLYRQDTFLEAMRVTAEPETRSVLTPQEGKRQQIIKVLGDHLNVAYTGDTRIAAINFSSPDPRLATRISNAFADQYIRSNLTRKLDSSSYALDFLRDQLRQAQTALEKSEQDAVDYARRTRIVDVSNAAGNTSAQGAQPQSLITAQLVQLNTALASARAERIEAEQKWQRVRNLPLLNIPEVLANQAIQGMVQKRAELQATYQEALANRQADHPSVIQARAGLEELASQITSFAGSIRNSVRNQYDVARSRENELVSTLEGLKEGTLSEQNQSIQFSILRREANTNRQQYESLLRRYNELNAESGVQTNNLSIVDRAQVPVKPSWPRLPLNIALGLFAGLVFSALVVILREQLFDAVRTPNDVETRLNVGLLGSIPRENEIIALLKDNKSTVSEAFASVRTSLSLAGDNGAPRTVMFTSSQAGEGKSSACHALGISFARMGRRVIIVDVDLRRPNAHRLFAMPNGKGLTHVVAGQLQLAAVINKSGITGLDLITVGDLPPNPAEQISSSSFGKILEQLSNDYDVVLLDSAPVLGLADAIVLSSQVEATIFVIEAGRNTVRGALSALARIQQGGGHVIGAILTKFDAGRFGYGYGTDYGNRYEYGSRD